MVRVRSERQLVSLKQTKRSDLLWRRKQHSIPRTTCIHLISLLDSLLGRLLSGSEITNPWRFRPLHQPYHEMYVPVNHLSGYSILLSGLNDIQHPSYQSALCPLSLFQDSNISQETKRGDVRIVSLNFSGASFIPLNTAPSLPISLIHQSCSFFKGRGVT